MIEFNPLDILATAAALKRFDSDDGNSDTQEASSSDNNGNENHSVHTADDNPDTSCSNSGASIEVNKMLNEHSYGHSKRNLKCISLYETSMGKSHTVQQDSIREGIRTDSSQQKNLVKSGDEVDMTRDNFLANVTHNMCVSDNLPEVESMEMDSEREEPQTSVIELENLAKVSTESKNNSVDIGVAKLSGTFINDEDLFFVSNVCESDSGSNKITETYEEQSSGENLSVDAINFRTTSASQITPDLLAQQNDSLVMCEHSCPDIIASHCNEMDSIDVDNICAKDNTSDTRCADFEVAYSSPDTDNKASSAVKTTDIKLFVDSAELCGNGCCSIVTKQCSSNARGNIKSEPETFGTEKISANQEKNIHDYGNDVNKVKDRDTLKHDSFTDIEDNSKVIDNVHPEILLHERIDKNIDIDILSKDKVTVKKSEDCYSGQFCSDHSYASLLPRDSSRLGDNCDNFDTDSEYPSTSRCRDATLPDDYRGGKENVSEVGDVAPAISIADDCSSVTKSCRDDCSDSNMSFSTLSDDFSGYSPSSPSTCSPVQTVPVYPTPTKDTTANPLSLSKSNSPRYGKFQIGTFASFSNSEIGLEESTVTRKIFPPPCGPNDMDSCAQKTKILASGAVDAIRNVGDSFLSSTASHPASALVLDPSHIQHDHDYCSRGNPPSSAISQDSSQQEYLASVGGNEKKHTKRSAEGRGKRTMRQRNSNASLSKSSDDMESKSEVMAEDSFDEFEASLDLEDSVRKATSRHLSDALPTRASRREPKMKITGSFQDDYVYFLSKKNRNRRRASCDPPAKVIPIKNAADIVVPHLSDADLELLKGQLSSACKLAHFSNYVGGASMQAARAIQPAVGTMTDADDAHLINTILSMESSSKNEDANVPYDTPASSSLIGAESFSGLNLTPEQMNVLMNAMALAQNDFGNFEDSATASLASCDEDLSPTDSISPLDNIDPQQANPAAKDLDKSATGKSQVFDFDEGFGMGVSNMDMMFDGGRPAESVPKEPSVEVLGSTDEGNKTDLETSSARTRPIVVTESPTKNLLQSDIPSISNQPVPINPLSDFSNLDRQFDILGGEFKLDKEDLFPEATVTAPETSTATVASPASEYNAPWIVTVTMYWNDLPAIMMNNRPYLRLVDIHKQVLPAKDTGILKKRCQLLGLQVQNCNELQRYFLVQYGKAYNSKSTLVITKDDAKKLIGYYVEPQPKVPRTDIHEHRNRFTNRGKSHVRSGKFNKAASSPPAPTPIVVGSSNDVSTSTIANEIIANRIETAEGITDSNDCVPVPDETHVSPVSRQPENMNSGRDNLRHNVAQTETTTSSSSDDESPVALEKKSRVVHKETVKESAKVVTPLAPIPAIRNGSTGTMSRLRHKKINFLEMLRGGTVSMDSDGDVENGLHNVDKTKGENENDENIEMCVSRSRHGRRSNLCENDKFTEVLCERSSKRATRDSIHSDDLTEVNIANIKRGPRKRRSAGSFDNARETVVKSEVPSATHMSQRRRLNAFKLRIKARRRNINKGEENKRNSMHRKKAMSKLSVKSSRFIAIRHRDSHHKNGTRNNIQNGDLYFNLFDQKKSPCIRCSTCRKYLSVDGFLCHLHEHGNTGKTTATNPSQVLELRNGDMSRFVMKQWELFQKKKVLFDNNQLREDGIDSAALKSAENEMNEGLRMLCKQQQNPSMRISSRVRKQKQLYPIENYAYANSAKRTSTDSDVADEVETASGINEEIISPSPTKLIKLGSKILGNADSPTKCSPLIGISESNVVALQNGPELMTFTALETSGDL